MKRISDILVDRVSNTIEIPTDLVEHNINNKLFWVNPKSLNLTYEYLQSFYRIILKNFDTGNYAYFEHTDRVTHIFPFRMENGMFLKPTQLTLNRYYPKLNSYYLVLCEGISPLDN